MTSATASLDERLCLALYTASRAMTSRYRPLLTQLGLTYPQYLVMVLLWEEGTCSVGTIGARLQLDTSTLSPLLKRLEASGLVVRRRGSHDERTVLVSLTERGTGLQGQGTDVHDAMCAAIGLGPADMAAMVTELRELAARLDG